MKSSVDEFSMTLGARLLTLVAAVGVQSCLAWWLGPEGRGAYAVSLVYAGLLTIVFAVASDVAAVYFVAAGRFSVSHGVAYSVVFAAISSALAITTGLLLMQLPLSFFEKATPTSLHLGLATIPAAMLALVLLRLLTALRDFAWFAILSVARVLAQLCFVVVLVWAFGWDVNGALLAVVASEGLIIGSTLVVLRWKHGLTWVGLSWGHMRQMFHYGIRYYVGKISNRANTQFGTILLALFATKAEIGLFAVAMQFGVKAMLLPEVFSKVLLPRVAAKGDTATAELVARCARLVAVVCGGILLVIAVFARPIIAVLFSPEFLPAAILVQILTLGVVVRCASKILAPYLIGTDHPGAVSISVAVGAGVNLALLVLLLPRVGLAGAAVAVMVGYLVSSTLLTGSFMRFSGLSLRSTWGFRRSDWAFFMAALKRIHSKVSDRGERPDPLSDPLAAEEGGIE